MFDTVLDMVSGDSEMLLRLLREVYLKGVDDGANAALNEDSSLIFHDWESVEQALNQYAMSLEDFVDKTFNAEENDRNGGF